MKNLIAMMNAMKVYKTNELVHDREAMQEKLSQDIDRPTYQKMVEKIQSKLFLQRP